MGSSYQFGCFTPVSPAPDNTPDLVDIRSFLTDNTLISGYPFTCNQRTGGYPVIIATYKGGAYRQVAETQMLRVAMQTVLIHLPGMIWWRLSPTPTMSAPISALGGWCVASPLCIDRQLVGRCDIFNILPDESILFRSDTLLLTYRGDNANLPNAADISTSIARFLNAIRVACKQPELPRWIVAHGPAHEIDDIVPPDDLHTTTTPSTFRRYILDSALTFDHLRLASDALTNDNVSVCAEMANDAAEATISSNYRSAIIFSAAAIESCAGSVLDAEYERQLNETQHDPERRFITIQVNRNETITKDPIYLALRNGAGDGGSRFLTLLHECPLYLLGRSLRMSEPELYRKSHSLYRTRNSLAHTGTIDGQQTGLLNVDFNGAIEAIEVANDVLNWFGESGTTVPDHEMVELATTDNT